MKSHRLYILAISIILIGCSELDESAPSQANSQLSSEDNISVSNNFNYSQKHEEKPIEGPIILVEMDDKDFSAMSSQELEAEFARIEKTISRMEVGMDTFSEDDSRWDILDSLGEKQIEISKEKTRRAKEKTREACERLRRARALAKMEDIDC